MDQQTNVWTKGNFGAPPAEQGPLGLFLPTRKLISAAWLPSRWERAKIKGWTPYRLTIPSLFPGLWYLDGGESAQFSGACPVYFALAGFSQYHSQPEGATVELYDVNTEMALVNPAGPALNIKNFGGDGKHPFWLKEFLFLDPGDVLLAQISNQSASAQQGQIVADGYQPQFAGVMKPQPKAAAPQPGVPFFMNR
jgi:hypothetical protein